VLPAAAQERRPIGVSIDGRPPKLMTITYKPAGEGPFPTLIFHFGSQPPRKGRALLPRPYNPKPLAQWFVERGWAVVFPARRGGIGSDGTYDEGFDLKQPQGSNCEPEAAVAATERALGDIDAVTTSILALPFVDRGRVAVGGQSRGGALAIAWSGRKPGVPRAVVNFTGGWFGHTCWSADDVNQALFKLGVPYGRPSLWLYGGQDPYYKLRESRGNFAAFEAAGGDGAYYSYEPPLELSGHDITLAPKLWSDDLEKYLVTRGLPAKPAL
jgi:dienelactone hydrolase